MSKIAIWKKMNGTGQDRMGWWPRLGEQDCVRKSHLMTVHEWQTRTGDNGHERYYPFMFVLNENEWVILFITVYYCSLPVIPFIFYMIMMWQEWKVMIYFLILSHSKGWGGNGPKINLAHACPGLIFAGKAKIIVGLRTKCGSTQIGHCLDPKYYIRVEVSIWQIP